MSYEKIEFDSRRVIIGSILNKDRKEVCGYYKNKPVKRVHWEIGKPLVVYFVDGGHFTHEKIIDVLEDDYGFWIETTKKSWRFDREGRVIKNGKK